MGGNNLFYYDTDFWNRGKVRVQRNVQVGDNLSGRKLFLSFPNTLEVRLDNYETVINGATNYKITMTSELTQVGGIDDLSFATETKIVVEENGTNTIVYKRFSSRGSDDTIVINLSDFDLSDNFGTVSNIYTSQVAYQYIKIEEEVTQSQLNLQEISGGDFTPNTISDRAYIVNAGNSSQSIEVPNGTYTISFKYKKIGAALANAVVVINGIEYPLTATEWTSFEKIVQVTNNNLYVGFKSDTDNTLYVADLLGNKGSAADVWTQHPNETRTDTVKIGKGIEVISSVQDTKLKADADGVRIVEVSNENNVVTEFTKEGTKIKQLIAENQAQIAGVMVQQIGEQTWFSSLL